MADFEGTKELNFDENIGLEELGRLRLENRDLQLTREKLVKKLEKKKNELEIERTNATTLRQFIQELNRKVELLEREPIPVISPLRIDPGAGLTGEVVERLVMEKTGLESNLEEQKTEIETLKSEITSMNTRLVLTNQNLEIVRGENDRFEKLVPELKLELSKMENECIRMSMSTNSEDKTIETDTLKTRVQNLSITNKHYLSQLQKKDLTIATTTNKFETEKQQILERSRLEIEKLKQKETSLNEQLIKVKRELDQKCSVEIQELTVNNNNIKSEKEKCKHELAKLDNQIIELMTELSSIRVYGREEEVKLSQEIEELKNEIHTLRATPGHNLQGAGESNERVGVLEVTIAELKGKATENKSKIKELRNENFSFEKENSDLKSEKMILKEQNTDLKESNLTYEKQIDELIKQQQQQPDGDANMELTSQLEAAKQQEFNNETEIRELKQEQDKNLILLQQKEETITVIEQPWKCLFCGDSYPSERERDIHMTDSCNNAQIRDDQSIVTQHRPPMGKELETKLTQSERDREDLERKLVEMIRELADRDSRKQELSQPVVIPQSRGQVLKSPSTPVMPTNPNLREKDKPLIKGNDSKSKEPSAGATSGATNMNLTPKVITQANKTNRSPSKIYFKGAIIHVVKLKAFPNPTESYNKQVICPINKRSELGVLICIIDLPTKVRKNKTTSKHAGIKLYNPVGNCDGAFRDERYFECSPNCGIFVPIEDVYVPVP